MQHVLYHPNPGADLVLDLVNRLATGLGQAPEVRPLAQLPAPTRRQKLLALRGTYQNCLEEVQHQLSVALQEPQRFAAELQELRAHEAQYVDLVQKCTAQLQEEGGQGNG